MIRNRVPRKWSRGGFSLRPPGYPMSQWTSYSVHWNVDIATPSLSQRLCFTISINRPHLKIKSNKCVKQNAMMNRLLRNRKLLSRSREFWDEGSFSTWNWLAGKSGSNHTLSKGRPPSYTLSSNFPCGRQELWRHLQFITPIWTSVEKSYHDILWVSQRGVRSFKHLCIRWWRC